MVHSSQMMKKPHEMVDGIRSKDDLVRFIQALSIDFQSRQHEWENVSLERYLAALSSWLADSDGYYRNQGREVPTNPSWRTLAEMLIAAKSYE